MQLSPVGTAEELNAWVEVLAGFTGPSAAEITRFTGEADVSREAALIKCPALIMHALRDPRIPFEEGRRLASLIPGARFVPVDSPNNVCRPSEPVFEEVWAEIVRFIGADRRPDRGSTFDNLTPRERDVLELIARGLDNLQIAAHLGLSEKTVRNHITPIFDKMGVENRSQAIVKAREAGLGVGKRPA
jgi:DNA-binding CsgD family transcriptional regulator